jgi:hypothetical protein
LKKAGFNDDERLLSLVFDDSLTLLDAKSKGRKLAQ